MFETLITATDLRCSLAENPYSIFQMMPDRSSLQSCPQGSSLGLLSVSPLVKSCGLEAEWQMCIANNSSLPSSPHSPFLSLSHSFPSPSPLQWIMLPAPSKGFTDLILLLSCGESYPLSWWLRLTWADICMMWHLTVTTCLSLSLSDLTKLWEHFPQQSRQGSESAEPGRAPHNKHQDNSLWRENYNITNTSHSAQSHFRLTIPVNVFSRGEHL